MAQIYLPFNPDTHDGLTPQWVTLLDYGVADDGYLAWFQAFMTPFDM